MVPIPAGDPRVGECGAVILALFHQLHDELRAEVEALDDESVNWTPCAGANSVATIVIHTLGSEAETLRAVIGLPGERDREAEFDAERRTVGQLISVIEHADELLHDLGSRITAAHLHRPTFLPTLDPAQLRSGTTWLAGNLGHAREHMGHLRLTAQLCRLNESA